MVRSVEQTPEQEPRYATPTRRRPAASGGARSSGGPRQNIIARATPATPTRTSRGRGYPSPAGKSPATDSQGSDDDAPSAAEPEEPTNSLSLWNTVRSKDCAVRTVALEWARDYRRQSSDSESIALLELANLAVKATGCTRSISRAQFDDQDSVTDCLEELQNATPDVTSYPFVLKSSEAKASKRAVLAFISALIGELGTTPIVMAQALGVLLPWIVTMSSSKARAFRHTATVLALHICASLCPLAIKSVSHSSKSSRNAAACGKQAANDLLQSLYKSVFMHRYRDSVPAIRRDCLLYLKQFIELAPEIFLDASYSRYFGWMLYDPDASVRQTSLVALCRLFALPVLANGMRLFSERFKSRILEMARAESDARLRAQAAQLLAHLHALHMLFDESVNITMIAALAFQVPAPSASATAQVSRTPSIASSTSAMDTSTSASGSGAQSGTSLLRVLRDELGDRDWPDFAAIMIDVMNTAYGTSESAMRSAATAMTYFVKTYPMPIYEKHEALVDTLLGKTSVAERCASSEHRRRRRPATTREPHPNLELYLCWLLAALAESRIEIVTAFCMTHLSALMLKFASQYEHLASLVRIVELAGVSWTQSTVLSEALAGILDVCIGDFFKCAARPETLCYIDSVVSLFAALRRTPELDAVVAPKTAVLVESCARMATTHEEHVRRVLRSIDVPTLDTTRLSDSDAHIEIALLAQLWRRELGTGFVDQCARILRAEPARIRVATLLAEHALAFNARLGLVNSAHIESALAAAFSVSSLVDNDAEPTQDATSMSEAVDCVVQVVKLVRAGLMELRFCAPLLQNYHRGTADSASARVARLSETTGALLPGVLAGLRPESVAQLFKDAAPVVLARGNAGHVLQLALKTLRNRRMTPHASALASELIRSYCSHVQEMLNVPNDDTAPTSDDATPAVTAAASAASIVQRPLRDMTPLLAREHAKALFGMLFPGDDTIPIEHILYGFATTLARRGEVRDRTASAKRGPHMRRTQKTRNTRKTAADSTPRVGTRKSPRFQKPAPQSDSDDDDQEANSESSEATESIDDAFAKHSQRLLFVGIEIPVAKSASRSATPVSAVASSEIESDPTPTPMSSRKSLRQASSNKTLVLAMPPVRKAQKRAIGSSRLKNDENEDFTASPQAKRVRTRSWLIGTRGTADDRALPIRCEL